MTMNQMKRGDLAARLAARLHAQAGINTSLDSSTSCGNIGDNFMALNRAGGTECGRLGTDEEGRSACGRQSGSGRWQYSAPDLDTEPPSGPLARLPFFRSFRLGEWVQIPSGVALSLAGSWVPPIPST